MRLAGSSLPMKNLEGEEGAPLFYTAQTCVEAFSEARAGKTLLVTDGSACGWIRGGGRVVTAVLADGDPLPLFAMPETAGVIACGRAEVLRAARYFAELQKLPCLILPVHAALDGAFETAAAIPVDGSVGTVPLAAGTVVCDLEKLRPTAAAAYCRLLLCRLALFERRALVRFGYGEFSPLCERAFSAVCDPPETVRGVTEANAVLRQTEAAGRTLGEGEWLFTHFWGTMSGYEVYHMLLSAYAAFFGKAKPRKYACPDYHLRAEAAGVPYLRLSIPAEEELNARACAFEGMRQLCNAELRTLLEADGERRRVFRKLGGEGSAAPDLLEEWKKLPERVFGLTAVMRDFGLLEF